MIIEDKILVRNKSLSFWKRIQPRLFFMITIYSIFILFALIPSHFAQLMIIVSIIVLLLIFQHTINTIIKGKKYITQVEIQNNHVIIEYLFYNTLKTLKPIPLPNFRIKMIPSKIQGFDRLKFDILDNNQVILRQHEFGEWTNRMMVSFFVDYKKTTGKKFSSNDSEIIADPEYSRKDIVWRYWSRLFKTRK